MELIANGLNGIYLRNFLPAFDEEIDCVLASIAYGSASDPLLKAIVNNGWRLDIWMRYDQTIPVTVNLLKWLLSNNRNSVFCKLVPDVLHSKVIWWKGYGAYIGSANLSDRAWNSNIEAGLFLTHEELISGQVEHQLEKYFQRLRDLPEARQLTDELVAHIESMDSKLRARRNELDQDARQLRKLEMFEGLNFEVKEDANSKARKAFLAEWSQTLTIMRDIAASVVEFRPQWVDPNTPKSWQADQFLHAFYYNRVKDGATYPYEKLHEVNQSDPWSAVKEALNWWATLKSPPSNEDVTFNKWAPCIRDHMRQDAIEKTTVKEFAEIVEATHATKDHLIKIPLSTFGIENQTSMPREDRIECYSQWIFQKKNKKGQNVIELIKYVLYDGPLAEIPERIYTAARDEDYSIPHYGLNSLAELVGWALPDVVPPRNGRTSKALRALGFDVRVY